MDAGPFPVDKRAALALLLADESLAEAENSSGLLPDPLSPNGDITAVARAGVVNKVVTSRPRPRPGLKRASNASPKQTEQSADEEGLTPPERNYDCPNYETCLGLAAALDWKSFTCKGCCGTVNQQLLWRAHHRIRNNPSLSKLCNLPVLTSS